MVRQRSGETVSKPPTDPSKTRIFLAAALLLLVRPADASITITFDLGAVFTAGGANPIAAGIISVLVGDVGGSGNFAQGQDLIGVTLDVGNSFGGANGRILGLVTATNNLYGLGVSGFSQNIIIPDALLTGLVFGTGGNTAGSDLAFYWFPGITTVGASVSAGQEYGFFREDSLAVLTPSGSTMSFNLPSNGDILNLAALTTGAEGNLPIDTFQANFLAIPEPSGALLSLAGLLLTGALPRRRRSMSA
jgi:hypothetical protein